MQGEECPKLWARPGAARRARGAGRARGARGDGRRGEVGELGAGAHGLQVRRAGRLLGEQGPEVDAGAAVADAALHDAHREPLAFARGEEVVLERLQSAQME